MRVAILGANGQVGTELALLMSARDPDWIVKTVVRSNYSRVLFDLVGVPCEVVDVTDAAKLRDTLADCDLVVDVTYPSGQTSEIRAALRRNIDATLASMRAGAAYAHMSSVSAFGMPSSARELRSYRLARTSYAQIKREGEQITLRLARKYGVIPYLFRLGEVHGVLQNVTSSYRDALTLGAKFVGRPDDPTVAVFVDSIDQALRLLLRHTLEPGLVYTLLSNPQWSLQQVLATYMNIRGTTVRVEYVADREAKLSASRVLRSARDVAEAQVLSRWSWAASKTKGLYRVAAARREAVAGSASSSLGPPSVTPLLGVCPGRLVPGLNSTPEGAADAWRAVEGKLRSVMPPTPPSLGAAFSS